MKKIITLIIILLLVSGCASLLKIKEKIPGIPGKTTSGKKDFIGGIQGIEATIVSPVEGGKAYSDQPFSIDVKVSNEGESEADGVTCISGLNPKYFSGFSGCECQDLILQGKRRVEGERLEGEEEVLAFEGGSINKGELTEFTVTAKTRYNYKTYGIITACVKKDAYSKEGCQISPDKNVIKSASSAPLGIVEVTEEIRPETDDTVKMIFTIEMKNSGRGDLYGLDENKAECKMPEDMKKRINVRMINAPGRATCNPAEIREGEATTHCTISNVKVIGEGNVELIYEPEITLELEYAYETIDSNQFEVV